MDWNAEAPFYNIEIKVVMPVFFGVLCSLVICALLGLSFGLFNIHEKEAAAEIEPVVLYEEYAEYDDDVFIFAASEKIPDIVLVYYRDPDFREWVINFFSDLCSSGEIAKAILENTDTYDVPPALAFALSWEESRFNPNAVNYSNRDGSIDRGLFQLNNRSFPNIDISGFFEIGMNARYGVAHLRFCLDSGASEVSALAMYNAGAARVRSTGAPEVTLNYISRILENRGKIESRFHSRLIREEELRLRTLISASPQ